MSSLFDFDKPELYAVMGNPVAHSKSPRIHTLFAAQTGQRMRYSAIQVDPGGFEQAVSNFVAHGGRGLNVTVPFKRNAWTLVERRSPRAALAQAVNTIVVEARGALCGDNTDGVGLETDLMRNHGVAIAGRSVLLLGAGGAASGVMGPLLAEQPARLFVANRTVDRALALAEQFARVGAVEGGGLIDLPGQQFDLVIIATAASLHGELPPLPDGLLCPGACCYDMMYGAAPTPFVTWARARGAAQALDGLGMLVEQAAESFHLWRGVRPETRAALVGEGDEVILVTRFFLVRFTRFRAEAEAAIYCFDEAGFGSGVNVMRFLERRKPVLGFYHHELGSRHINTNNILQLAQEHCDLVSLRPYAQLEEIPADVRRWVTGLLPAGERAL